MSARFIATGKACRSATPRAAWAVVLVLGVAVPAVASAAQPARPAVAGSTAPATDHQGSPSRPDYDCSKGGFCGAEGWAYGSYAADTKESTGCGPGPNGVDNWDLSASHSPILPDFARPYCAFLYGFATCSLPTVICEN